ncbi:MAG: Ig family protein [Acidobacteriaceae bacterium]|jgi:uncharacterized membrane protein|nr:Ig family protein [Acidobacteriaceae bacterium]
MSFLKALPILLFANLVLSLTSFAQTETCNYKLISVHGNGSANGVNRSNIIVGSYILIKNGQGYFRGFIRQATGEVATYLVPGAQSTYLTGINDKGSIVGGYAYQPATQAYGFELMGNKFIPINYPGAGITDPSGINNKGQVVGTESPDITSPGKGFLLNKGQFTDIQFPGANATGANAINDTGMIVGSYLDQNSSTHGFVLIQGQYTSLDFPGSNFTIATGINNAGEIVGQYTLPPNGSLQSFVYKNGQFKLVSIPHTYRSSVNGVNALGDIVGTTFTYRQTQPSFLGTSCK